MWEKLQVLAADKNTQISMTWLSILNDKQIRGNLVLLSSVRATAK